MNQSETWGVWCRRNCGPNGPRQAWTEDRDGKPLQFATRDDAHARARALQDGLGMHGSYAVLYTARPYDGPPAPFASEPTEQGNQLVIPGCEKDRTRGPKQGDLF